MRDTLDTTEEISTGRRQFTQGVAALGGLAIAPGVFLYHAAGAKPDDQAVSSQQRWGMLVNTNNCHEECDACVTACNEENGVWSLGRPETDAQWIRKLNVRDRQTGHVTSMPMMCQHCEHPPCVDVCPTRASFRREDGIVLVNKHTCIGCRYCMMACPLQGAFLHPRAVTGSTASFAPGQGMCGKLYSVRAQGGPGRQHYGLCRGLCRRRA